MTATPLCDFKKGFHLDAAHSVEMRTFLTLRAQIDEDNLSFILKFA